MVKSWQEVVIVSEELPEEVQRWTAKRRSALIVSIIRGETSVQEAARKYGLTVAEVEDWREKFLSGAENALRSRPRDEEAQKDEQIKKLKQKVGELILDMDILKEAQKGRPFWASFKMSMSRMSSPTFCFSFLICSSFWASSSLGLERSAFSAPERNFSRQSSTSATVRPYLRAASCTEVSPLMMLTINAERLLAVHRWTSSGSSSLTITTSCRDFSTAYGWLQI